MPAQGGWTTQHAHSLRLLARSRLRGPRSFAHAPGAPVSQASGLLLVPLDQDYQANTPHVRTHLQYKRARQWARFCMARGGLENRDFAHLYRLFTSCSKSAKPDKHRKHQRNFKKLTLTILQGLGHRTLAVIMQKKHPKISFCIKSLKLKKILFFYIFLLVGSKLCDIP